MKLPKNNGFLSISQLAKLYNHDRATVARRLGGTPFIIGAKGSKLYDPVIAAAAIESRDRDMATLVFERARRAEIEREIKQIQLDALQKRMVPVEVMVSVMADLVAALRSEIDGWPITEANKQRCFLSMEAASIAAFKATGSDTRAREQDLAGRRKKLEMDIAGGKFPDTWTDAVLPQNHRRVWDEKLARYMSKNEIIARYGQSAQISPIDEIVAEVAQEEADE